VYVRVELGYGNNMGTRVSNKKKRLIIEIVVILTAFVIDTYVGEKKPK